MVVRFKIDVQTLGTSSIHELRGFINHFLTFIATIDIAIIGINGKFN